MASNPNVSVNNNEEAMYNLERRMSQRVKKRVNYAKLASPTYYVEEVEVNRTRKKSVGKKVGEEGDEGMVEVPVVMVNGSGGEGVGVVVVDVLELGVAGIVGWNEKSDYAKVKETVRLFNSYYLHFTQAEELRVKRFGANRQSGEGQKRASKRPDLKAATKMRLTKSILFPRKIFGHLPGIDAGYQFYSRCEMVAVGLHTHWLKGIDYMLEEYGKLNEEYKNYVFPLCMSIVMSGMYEDDLDNLDNVVYTGQGGNDINGKKCQVSDQKMISGNLALKNNIDQNVPVRVIRGHQSPTSYVGKVYTYDGLYKVCKYWAEKGISGFTVYKFSLQRMEGQAALTTTQVQYVQEQAPQSLSDVRGLVADDISGGDEIIPVPATNLVDMPAFPPTGYKYLKSVQVPEGINLPENAQGCGCNGDCVNPNICRCAKLNCGFPYVLRDGGRLIQAKPVVYECGPNCGCGPQCINRLSQQGLKYRLEVFRTPQKGWAVRSWDCIPSGAPVCEYTGILKRTDEINDLSDNKFLFELDCKQTMEGLGGREQRIGDVALNLGAHLGEKEATNFDNVPEFCIDAGPAGSVARFINHSCEPNLFVQSVVSSHHDLRLTRVMLFAADNIPPLQELNYDYGYDLDSVHGPDGEVQILPCYCGAPSCRKRLH